MSSDCVDEDDCIPSSLPLCEDFSNMDPCWTDYDPDSRITYNQKLEFNNWIRTERGFVHREIEPVSDFQLKYDFNISAYGGNAKSIGPLISDTYGSITDLQNNLGNGIWIQFYAGIGAKIYIQTYQDGIASTDLLSNSTPKISITTKKNYYVTFTKNGSLLTLSIFSDESRTSHIPGSPIYMNANFTGIKFDHFYSINSNVSSKDIANWEWSTGWIDNIKLYDQVPPLPMADEKKKFLGNIYSPGQKVGFENYWNQIVPDNAGKWGSVQSKDSNINFWDWSDLDSLYQEYVLVPGMESRFHVLIWGNQQPLWIDSFSPSAQLAFIKKWFSNVAEKYPKYGIVEVVNEPIHNPPDGEINSEGKKRANYINALDGPNNWNWVMC
jgi:hypothetical protein